MADANEDWFRSDLLHARSVSSSIWTVIFSTLWLISFKFILFFLINPFHPIWAFLDSIQMFFSPRFLFYLSVINAMILWSSYKHSQNFTVTPSVFHSWSKLMQSCIRPNIVLSLTQFSIRGTSIAWCLTKIFWPQYSSIFVSCMDHGSEFCLNFDHMFLLGSGTFTGFILGLQYHFSSGSCVTFPIIFKEHFCQIKEKMSSLAVKSLTEAFYTLKYYYLMCILMTVTIPGLGLASISNIISLMLFGSAVSIAFFNILSNSIMLRIFNVYLSGPLPSIPIEQLLSSLSAKEELLRLLSMQSLSKLAANSPNTRKVIFSLSQPGGHANNWKAVSQSCLESIEVISSSIASLTQSPKQSQNAPITPPIDVHHLLSPNMRRLAPYTSDKIEDVSIQPTVSPAKQILDNFGTMFDLLKKQPVISILFKVEPDAKMRSVFCLSQRAIWAVDSLSYLVAHSITEDNFGVVQKELPSILKSLLVLDQMIYGPRRNGSGDVDLKLKNELKGIVKCALYRIAINFGEHINSIPLEREFKIKINNFQKMLDV